MEIKPENPEVCRELFKFFFIVMEFKDLVHANYIVFLFLI